jgi:hypothetical protein
MKDLKFVWEFFGSDSEHLAKHHLNHLKEFLIKEKIIFSKIGVSKESLNFSYSFVVLDSSFLEIIKSSLKPHKAFKV